MMRPMKDMSEWIAANGITMVTTRAEFNPNMDSDHFMWHWRCELSRAGRKMTVPFSMGEAHATGYKQGARTILDKEWNHTAKTAVFRLGQEAFRNFGVIPTPPDAGTVLDCLAADAAGHDNADSFEDWAAEYGYETDSRKAERTYNLTGTQAGKLRRFLGNVLYEELLYQVERL
jgi:hypothetical protein